MAEIKSIKFFISPVYPYGNDHYFHEMIALAEGFEQLGYKIIGNCNYWFVPSQNKFLIQEDLEADFDLAIYDYRYAQSFAHLLFRKGFPNFDRSKKHILIDRNDWHSPFWLQDKRYLDVFDVIAAGNLYENFSYPEKIKPWAIGLTNRIIHAIDTFYNEDKIRKMIIGYNFRVEHNMRGFLLKKILNQELKYKLCTCFTKETEKSTFGDDSLFYQKTTKRHSLSYYNQLTESMCFLTFGGYYEMKPCYYEPYTFFQKFKRKPFYWSYKSNKKRGKDFSNQVFIFQHDSFRFWEVLYSGSVAINIDLDYWKFKLPIKPETKKQYLGISSICGVGFDKMMNELSEMELKNIGKEGRHWVHTHYSPEAQARRVLTYIE